MEDKKYNIIVHLNPVIDDGDGRFSWVLWHDMGTYGKECGSGIADTELDAFEAAFKTYKNICKGDEE